MAELNDFEQMTKTPQKVFEVTEDLFWYALEVLPPIYGKGCFGMGEAYSGEWFYWFAEIKGTGFFGFLGSQSEAEKAFADHRALNSIKHCQNCNSYHDNLTVRAGLKVCLKCNSKLEAAEMKKRQISFFDDQTPLFNF